MTDQEILEFYMFIKNNDILNVSLLMRKGVDPNMVTGDLTPLWVAIANERVEIVYLLVDNGVDLNQKFNKGLTCLQATILTENLQMLKILLELGADPYTLGRDGLTALHDAILYDNPEMVKILIDHGADPNKPDTMDGLSPIQMIKERKDDFLYYEDMLRILEKREIEHEYEI